MTYCVSVDCIKCFPGKENPGADESGQSAGMK